VLEKEEESKLQFVPRSWIRWNDNGDDNDNYDGSAGGGGGENKEKNLAPMLILLSWPYLLL
jgi:hypothetical protein